MKEAEFMSLLNTIQQNEAKLTGAKSNDYADDDEHLKNFKDCHAVLKTLDIDPRRGSAHVALVYIILKIQRLSNLLRKGVGPTNEAIVDTILDARLYLALLHGCLEDKKGEK